VRGRRGSAGVRHRSACIGLIAEARAHVHGTVLDNAAIGSISIEYLDLLLAAVLGGIVAGHAIQRRAAVLVTMLAAGYGMLLPVVDPLPATVPVALAVILLRWGGLAQRWQTVADCTACRYAASERLSWCQPRNMVDGSRRTRTARP
jgi:hypothetical protein